MKKIIIALIMIMGIFLIVIGVFLSHENHNIDNKSNRSKLIRENQIKRYKTQLEKVYYQEGTIFQYKETTQNGSIIFERVKDGNVIEIYEISNNGKDVINYKDDIYTSASKVN